MMMLGTHLFEERTILGTPTSHLEPASLPRHFETCYVYFGDGQELGYNNKLD